VKRLGRPASHGCVRLSRENAATLFALVKEQGLKQTKVVLTGELPDAVAATGSILREEQPRKRARLRDDFLAPPPYYSGPYFPRRYGGFPFGW
jgi:L,D-transpeptidase-like protein